MLLLKTVTMPSKADVPAIAKLREEMPSGPDAFLPSGPDAFMLPAEKTVCKLYF